MSEHTDEQLVVNYLKGEKDDFEVLVRKYLKPIFGFVYHYLGNAADTEDVTQEVFLRVWKNIKKFDPEKSFKTWIFSIAKNAALDFIKKKKTIPFSNFTDEAGDNIILETLSDPAPLPDELFDQQNLAEVLDKSLEKISPKYRTVLYLYYINQFNFREIAESLNEPINTIKSRHRRALVALREVLLADKNAKFK